MNEAKAKATFCDLRNWNRTVSGKLRRGLPDRSWMMIEGGAWQLRYRSGPETVRGTAASESEAIEACWTTWKGLTLELSLATELSLVGPRR